MKSCLCGKPKSYNQCCGLYHRGAAAPDPESLMRSRYSAYAMANMDYIVKTMRDKPLQGFNAEKTEKWAKSVNWLGLQVLNATQPVDSRIGFVEFKARYMENAETHVIHELSEFHYEDGRWYYVHGTHKSD